MKPGASALAWGVSPKAGKVYPDHSVMTAMQKEKKKKRKNAKKKGY